MCVVYDNEVRMSFGYVHEWIEVMFHHVSALEVGQKDYAEVRHDITEILLKVRVKQSINQSCRCNGRGIKCFILLCQM